MTWGAHGLPTWNEYCANPDAYGEIYWLWLAGAPEPMVVESPQEARDISMLETWYSLKGGGDN